MRIKPTTKRMWYRRNNGARAFQASGSAARVPEARPIPSERRGKPSPSFDILMRLVAAGWRHHFKCADRHALLAGKFDQQPADVHLVAVVIKLPGEQRMTISAFE